MMEIRKLEKKDKDAVMELVLSRDEYMGISKKTADETVENQVIRDWYPGGLDAMIERQMNDFYLAGSQMLEARGCFVDGTLQSMIAINFGDRTPTWLLSRMIVRNGLAPEQSGICALFESCIAYCESLGYADYFTAVPVRLEKAHDRMWGSRVPSRARYDVFTEENVPAGTMPKYVAHRMVLNEMMWPIDIVIRRHCLQENFRRPVLMRRQELYLKERLRWNDGGAKSDNSSSTGLR